MYTKHKVVGHSNVRMHVVLTECGTCSTLTNSQGNVGTSTASKHMDPSQQEVSDPQRKSHRLTANVYLRCARRSTAAESGLPEMGTTEQDGLVFQHECGWEKTQHKGALPTVGNVHILCGCPCHQCTAFRVNAASLLQDV